jgi:hypothetical protein
MIRARTFVVAGLLLVGVGLAQAAEEGPPPAGSWKVFLPMEQELAGRPLWLLKFENKDGKWEGSVLATGEGIVPPALENLTVGNQLLRFDLKITAQSTFRFEINVPKEKAAKMLGVFLTKGRIRPAELEATTLTSLHPFDIYKEMVAKSSGGTEVITAAQNLLGMAGERKARPEEVRAWAARAIKVAESYSPRWQREIALNIALILGEQKGYESIALTYARQAERQLEDKDRPDFRQKVLRALATALAQAGKAEEAKEVEGRLNKIDFTLKPEPFPGRRGKSDSVVLVELFTGTQCPPCVAADLAFDALGKTFKPSEVVRLQYHVHVPGPDPLTTPASEARMEYYSNFVRGTPTVLYNGRPVAPGGGDLTDSWEKYDEYVENLVPLLERPARARLKATAQRKGSTVSIDVTASEVQEESDKVRLRVVLVEEQIDYTGSNKVASHHHVVRAFPGGVEGTKIEKGKALNKTLTVDLDKVRKDLTDYLDKADGDKPFPKKDRRLDLKKLAIVAFVQNDATREVLQAVQAEVVGD